MTHLGFQIINLTSNSRTNLGEEDRAKRRKQRKVAVFRIDFPFPCWPPWWVWTWGHHQMEGRRRTPGGLWCGVITKLQITGKEGTLASCVGWTSFLVTVGELLSSSLGKHIPWETQKSSLHFPLPLQLKQSLGCQGRMSFTAWSHLFS